MYKTVPMKSSLSKQPKHLFTICWISVIHSLYAIYGLVVACLVDELQPLHQLKTEQNNKDCEHKGSMSKSLHGG